VTLNQLHAEIKSRCQDYGLTPSVISAGTHLCPHGHRLRLPWQC
jgi:hypothetical protein